MAKSDELVKYITQRVVTYMNLPPEVRRQNKHERIQIRKKTQVPWHYKWFGMLPTALSMWVKSIQDKRKSFRR